MASEWIVSPYALVSWKNGQIEIISASSGAKFLSSDVTILYIVDNFKHQKTIEDALSEFEEKFSQHILNIIKDLIKAGVLILASEQNPAVLNNWDCSSLFYHHHSRQTITQKGRNTIVSNSNKILSKNWVPLKAGFIHTRQDMAEVLESRISWRKWSSVPIPFEIFSAFFWLSARNKKSVHGEYLSRPYPSGGAIYSLEIYVVIANNAVEVLNPGLYRYLPEHHGLDPITLNESDFLPILIAAGNSAGTPPPPIVILITSHYKKQSEAYGALAYSLILKEVGGLFQTFYLIGEYLKLGTCALGGGISSKKLNLLCNTNELSEPLVGEFIIGSR